MFHIRFYTHSPHSASLFHTLLHITYWYSTLGSTPTATIVSLYSTHYYTLLTDIPHLGPTPIATIVRLYSTHYYTLLTDIPH